MGIVIKLNNQFTMVEATANQQAEAKKNQGNEAFKRQDFQSAIRLYTEALRIQPSETILSNRAAVFISMKQFRKAVEDCQAGIRINPQFARIYKRLFKSQLALGNIQDAQVALETAIQLDPSDATNAKDKESLTTLNHMLNLLERFTTDENDQDFERAVTYCTNIM